MQLERLQQLRDIYRDGLLNDTLPFWLPRAIDREYGGYLTSLDRDGTILNTDKAVWFQGRFAWILATLYDTVEPRPEWLEYSAHGIDFQRKHCSTPTGGCFSGSLGRAAVRASGVTFFRMLRHHRLGRLRPGGRRRGGRQQRSTCSA